MRLTGGWFPGMEAAVAWTTRALDPVSPEAARLTRRLLDDAFLMERGAAQELTKAARYQIGIPRSPSWPTP
jgi:hypothetical protein